MLGLGLLVRLGRQVLAGPVADSGVLPAGYYRHLVLAALEEEDFPGALRHLKWAENPLLAQIMVLRLRLLSARHRQQLSAIEDLLRSELTAGAPGAIRVPAGRRGPGPGIPPGLRNPGAGALGQAGDRPPPSSDPEKAGTGPATTSDHPGNSSRHGTGKAACGPVFFVASALP